MASGLLASLLVISPLTTRAAGIAAGVVADAIFGDPRRHHPVAWFGTAVGRVEQIMYGDSRARGAAFTAAVLAPLAVGGLAVERATRRHPVAHVAATALATWAVVGSRSLAAEGQAMAEHLADGDLAAARERITHLCGRDPEALDAPELARATVESVAENAADAVVASLTWGALAGIPGLLVHRGANTLDAMVGHLTPRYRRFGTASARLDDTLDYLPARLTGALACACAPVVGGSTSHAIRIMSRDAHDHPSPNGGWCEAAWAGALGVQLGGTNVYASGVESRGLLGDGPRPGPAQVREGATLLRAVTATATTLAATGLLVAARLRSRKDH